MARDFFAQFKDCRWKGVSFPLISLSMVLRHDLAIHRYVGRDGADIESTGRAPFEFTAEIPFYNDIDPGPRESWQKGKLYPTQWKAFLAAAADKSSGDFQHPELGVIRCKLESMRTMWDAAKRGGVPVSATWLETTDDPNQLASLISSVSPLAGAIQAAQDIDRHLKVLTPPLPTTPAYAPTFGDTMRSIQGVFDQSTLLSKRVGGVIDQVAYRANAVLAAMQIPGISPTTALNATQGASISVFSQSQVTASANVQHVKNWPLIDAIQRLQGAITDLRNNQLLSKKKVGLYSTPMPGTLGKAAIAIPAPISDLMQLNPNLMGSPIVPANQFVRYYLP